MKKMVRQHNGRGRPRKSDEPGVRILRTLRREIVLGGHSPGARLATRVALMRRFGVTSNTVNSALQRLKVQGFIRPAGRHGTFVSDRPPHICRYGLLFRGHPSGAVPQEWSNYWTLIEQEARRLAARRRLDVVSYYGITRHVDEPDYQRLLEDIKADRLAGLFCVYPLGSDFSYDLPKLKCPVVALSESHPVHAVTFDNDRWSLVEKAARYLAARGRRRVAWIGENQHEMLRARLKFLRINGGTAAELFPDDLAVYLNVSSRATAAQLVRLLMRQERHSRPDAILLLDDHLVEYAGRGLVEAGAKVPAEVDVVAHCNYPAPPASPIPTRWLGFDAADLVLRAFDAIRDRRFGKADQAPSLLPALWEEEWRRQRKLE